MCRYNSAPTSLSARTILQTGLATHPAIAPHISSTVVDLRALDNGPVNTRIALSASDDALCRQQLVHYPTLQRSSHSRVALSSSPYSSRQRTLAACATYYCRRLVIDADDTVRNSQSRANRWALATSRLWRFPTSVGSSHVTLPRSEHAPTALLTHSPTTRALSAVSMLLARHLHAVIMLLACYWHAISTLVACCHKSVSALLQRSSHSRVALSSSPYSSRQRTLAACATYYCRRLVIDADDTVRNSQSRANRWALATSRLWRFPTSVGSSHVTLPRSEHAPTALLTHSPATRALSAVSMLLARHLHAVIMLLACYWHAISTLVACCHKSVSALLQRSSHSRVALSSSPYPSRQRTLAACATYYCRRLVIDADDTVRNSQSRANRWALATSRLWRFPTSVGSSHVTLPRSEHAPTALLTHSPATRALSAVSMLLARHLHAVIMLLACYWHAISTLVASWSHQCFRCLLLICAMIFICLFLICYYSILCLLYLNCTIYGTLSLLLLPLRTMCSSFSQVVELTLPILTETVTSVMMLCLSTWRWLIGLRARRVLRVSFAISAKQYLEIRVDHFFYVYKTQEKKKKRVIRVNIPWKVYVKFLPPKIFFQVYLERSSMMRGSWCVIF